MEREIRYLSTDQAILRNEDADSRTISGYALVFNQESRDLGGFTEIILPESVHGLFPNQDIVALFNHDEDRGVLARYTNGKGTLTLEVDEIGLRYSFEADDSSPLAIEVLSAIRRGDINTSSFAFTIKEDDWTKRKDNTYIRTIKQFKDLYDVSPVVRAAYPQTSVAARKLEELREEDKKEIEEAKAEADKKAKAEKEKAEKEELDKYYQEWNEKVKTLDKTKETE